jgi:hypothetical protein
MFETSPVTGMGRRPQASDPPVVTKELANEFAKGKKEYRPNEYMDDTCYWFMNKDGARIRSLFLGSGGLTTMFLAPSQDAVPPAPPLPAYFDPKSILIPKFLRDHPMMKPLLADFQFDNHTAIPSFLRSHPAVQRTISTFHPEQTAKGMAALSSNFGPKSKELFAFNMKRNLKFETLPFIIPLLGTQDFFAHSEEDVKSWFTFFDVYINESPEDEGILMAARDNLKPVVASIVTNMRQAGYRYWEG